MTRGLVLTHGAGTNCESPLLVAVAEAFRSAGYQAMRIDMAFRQRRPFGPPSPATAPQDRESLREAVARMRELVDGPVVLGGHSYGGRQATMLAAEAPEVADALLLLSYPLHPPNRPDKPRTSHFPALRTPSLFVHGAKDPFGTIEEMRAALETIPAAKELVTLDGLGHDLARGHFDIAQLPRLLAALQPEHHA
jgi:predicted alpha/beta-hydrolase family hydrolase